MRYKKYTIAQGDTLQLIAQNTMGDMAFWEDIASHNKLVHPFIVEDPHEKMTNQNVVCYGDNIIIPLEVTIAELETTPLTYETKRTIEELTLGRDFSFTGDLNYASTRGTQDEILEMTSDGRGRIQYVAGVENLKQALLHRLWTKKGTLPLHPEYGSELHTFIGKKITSTLLVDVAVELQRICNIDQRIEETKVTRTTAAKNDTMITVDISIRPIGMDKMLPIIFAMDNAGSITLD